MPFWWFLAQLTIDLIMINRKLLKLISPFHTFQYPKGQIGITSLWFIRLQNFNHHYKWENVYFCDIPRTQFWPCAQNSFILTDGSHINDLFFFDITMITLCQQITLQNKNRTKTHKTKLIQILKKMHIFLMHWVVFIGLIYHVTIQPCTKCSSKIYTGHKSGWH